MELFTKKRQSFLIDDDDFNLVKDINWSMTNGYFIGYFKKNKKQYYLHRVIMGIHEYSSPMVDHINGDRSDNRKANLRLCTNAENSRNRKSTGSSIYLGVSKINSKFHAKITTNQVKRFLGVFDTEIKAAEAYNNAAKEYHGEFANLNKIT